MITSAPGCRTACNGNPGDVVEHLIEVFWKLRVQGASEEQALLVARDPEQVARLLPANSLGALRGTAEALVISGCVECAVNYAYAREAP